MADNKINFIIDGKANFQPVYAELSRLKEKINEVSVASRSVNNLNINTSSLKTAQKDFAAQASAIRGVRVEMVNLSDGAAHLSDRLLNNKRSFSDMVSTWRAGSKHMTDDMKRIGDYQAKLHESMVLPSAVSDGQAMVVTNFAKTADAALRTTKTMQAYNTEMLNLGNKMVNFGKNTQWAGRQLTVGFTVPLLAAGGAISAMFLKVDEAMRKLMMVYGVGGGAGQGFQNIVPSVTELEKIRSGVMALSQEMAALYGQSADATTAVAADLAAAGYTQQQLLDMTKIATSAMVLGQTDQQSAVKATIAIQNAYKLNVNQTTEALQFFSAAQATTSTNMQDLIDSVPRVGPIIKNLGGTYKDTVAMIVAMKEGGVAAGEGANALKNSMQRIVAPTESAKKTLKSFGIQLDDIAKSGSPVIMIQKLQDALSKLDAVSRQQAITELFGKFQAARMTALLDNFNRAGTQSAKVMEMMSLSADQLGQIQERQIQALQESPSMRFQAAIESLKAKLIPIGEKLIEIVTPLVNGITWVISALDKIGPIKYLLAGGLGFTAILGPLIMFGGLISNLIGQMFKISQQMRMFKEGFTSGGGLAKPFTSLAAGLKATQNYLEEFDAAQHATEKSIDALTDSNLIQAESFRELTKALAEYRQELERISRGDPSGGSGGPGGPIIGGGGGYPRLPTGGPTLPQGIVGDASRPIQVEAMDVRLRDPENNRGKLIPASGNADITFAHMRPKRDTIEGSNTLNIPGYEPSSNAQGTFGIVPGYLAGAVGADFNNTLKDKPHPIIPTGMNTEAMVRQVMSEVGVKNITDEMVRVMMQELSLENAGGVEAAKLAQMQALSMLQNDTDFMARFRKLATMSGADAEDVDALFAERLGPVWEQMKVNASESVLKLYEQAQQEAMQAIEENWVSAPQTTAEGLGLVAGRFSELISEQIMSIASTYSDKLIQSMTINSPDLDNVTEQMKRKTAVRLVNAGTTAQSMMNPFMDALESLIQQTRGLVTQMTSEARMATANIASMSARGAMQGIVGIAKETSRPPKPVPPPGLPLATGGKVYGPGGPKDDLIPALLSDGEYVVRADAVGHYGSNFLDAVNNKKLAGGGILRRASGGIARFAQGTGKEETYGTIRKAIIYSEDEDAARLARSLGYTEDIDLSDPMSVARARNFTLDYHTEGPRLEGGHLRTPTEGQHVLPGELATVPRPVNQIMAASRAIIEANDPALNNIDTQSMYSIVGVERKGQFADWEELKTTSNFIKGFKNAIPNIGKNLKGRFSSSPIKSMAYVYDNPYNNSAFENQKLTENSLNNSVNVTDEYLSRMLNLGEKEFSLTQDSLRRISDQAKWQTPDRGGRTLRDTPLWSKPRFASGGIAKFAEGPEKSNYTGGYSATALRALLKQPLTVFDSLTPQEVEEYLRSEESPFYGEDLDEFFGTRRAADEGRITSDVHEGWPIKFNPIQNEGEYATQASGPPMTWEEEQLAIAMRDHAILNKETWKSLDDSTVEAGASRLREHLGQFGETIRLYRSVVKSEEMADIAPGTFGMFDAVLSDTEQGQRFVSFSTGLRVPKKFAKQEDGLTSRIVEMDVPVEAIVGYDKLNYESGFSEQEVIVDVGRLAGVPIRYINPHGLAGTDAEVQIVDDKGEKDFFLRMLSPRSATKKPLPFESTGSFSLAGSQLISDIIQRASQNRYAVDQTSGAETFISTFRELPPGEERDAAAYGITMDEIMTLKQMLEEAYHMPIEELKDSTNVFKFPYEKKAAGIVATALGLSSENSDSIHITDEPGSLSTTWSRELLAGRPKLAGGGIAKFPNGGFTGGYSREAIEGLYAAVGKTAPEFTRAMTEEQLKEYLASPESPFYGTDLDEFFASREAGLAGMILGDHREGWQGAPFQLEEGFVPPNESGPVFKTATQRVVASDPSRTEEERMLAELAWRHAHEDKRWDTVSQEQLDAGAATLRQHLAQMGTHMRLYRSLVVSEETAANAPGNYGIFDGDLSETENGQTILSFSTSPRIPKNFANPDRLGHTPRIVEADVPIEAIVAIDRMNYDSEQFKEQEVLVDVRKLGSTILRYVNPTGFAKLGSKHLDEQGNEVRDPSFGSTPVAATSGRGQEAEFLEMISPRTAGGTEAILWDMVARGYRGVETTSSMETSFLEQGMGSKKTPEEEAELYGIAQTEIEMAKRYLEQKYGMPIEELKKLKYGTLFDKNDPELKKKRASADALVRNEAMREAEIRERDRKVLDMVARATGLRNQVGGFPVHVTETPGTKSALWSERRITGTTSSNPMEIKLKQWMADNPGQDPAKDAAAWNAYQKWVKYDSIGVGPMDPSHPDFDNPFNNPDWKPENAYLKQQWMESQKSKIGLADGGIAKLMAGTGTGPGFKETCNFCGNKFLPGAGGLGKICNLCLMPPSLFTREQLAADNLGRRKGLANGGIMRAMFGRLAKPEGLPGKGDPSRTEWIQNMLELALWRREVGEKPLKGDEWLIENYGKAQLREIQGREFNKQMLDERIAESTSTYPRQASNEGMYEATMEGLNPPGMSQADWDRTMQSQYSISDSISREQARTNDRDRHKVGDGYSGNMANGGIIHAMFGRLAKPEGLPGKGDPNRTEWIQNMLELALWRRETGEPARKGDEWLIENYGKAQLRDIQGRESNKQALDQRIAEQTSTYPRQASNEGMYEATMEGLNPPGMSDADWDRTMQSQYAISDAISRRQARENDRDRYRVGDGYSGNMAMGGFLSLFAGGGKAFGPGGPKDDLIPAMISNGEYVINADAVGHYGVSFIDAINAKKLASGGIAGFAKGSGGQDVSEMTSFEKYDMMTSTAGYGIMGIMRVLQGGGGGSEMFVALIDQIKNLSLGFKLINEKAEPVKESLQDLGDRQIVRAGIVMEDLESAGKKVTEKMSDYADQIKEKIAERKNKKSYDVDEFFSTEESKKIKESNQQRTILEGKKQILDDFFGVTQEDLAESENIKKENQKKATDGLQSILSESKEGYSIDDMYEEANQSVGAKTDNRGKARKGLDKLGSLLGGAKQMMGGQTGMMLGAGISMGANMLSSKMVEDSGGPTGTSEALSYGANTYAALSMFGPQVALPAAAAAAALGYALGDAAEKERHLTEEIKKGIQNHQQYQASMSVSGEALSQLGLKMQTIDDLKFTHVKEQADAMTQSIDQLADSMKNGSEQSKAMVAYLANANPAEQNRVIETQFYETLQAGGDIEKATTMAAAAAKAANLSPMQSKTVIDNLRATTITANREKKDFKQLGFEREMERQKYIDLESATRKANAAVETDAVRKARTGIGARFGGNAIKGVQANIAAAKGVDYVEMLNLKKVDTSFDINDTKNNFGEILDAAKDKTGKEIFQSGDARLINAAKMAGIDANTSAEETTKKLQALDKTLQGLTGDSQKLIQSFVNLQGDFKAAFVTPVSQAMASLKPDQFEKFLSQTMEKVGDNYGQLVEQIATELGPEFEKLIPAFNGSAEAAEKFIRAMQAVKGITTFASEEAQALAADQIANDKTGKLESAAESQAAFELAWKTDTANLVNAVGAAEDAAAIRERLQAAMKALSKQFKADQEAVQEAFKAQQKAGQEQIKGIQKEMEARQKLYDLKQKTIQQDQTMMNMQNEISKARNSGDLLALAAAQNTYNNELNKQNAEKAKEKADDADKAKIENIQKRMEKEQEAFDARMKAMQEEFDKKMEAMQNDMDNADIDAQKAKEKAAKNKILINDEMTDLKELAKSRNMTEPEWKEASQKHVKRIAELTGREFSDVQEEVEDTYNKGQEFFDQGLEFLANGQIGRIDMPGSRVIVRPDGSLVLQKDASVSSYVDLASGSTVGDLGSSDTVGVGRFSGKSGLLGVATGGHIRGPGTETSDSIPAMLSDGEYVVKARSVKKYGAGFLDAINAGHYANGGMVNQDDRNRLGDDTESGAEQPGSSGPSSTGGTPISTDWAPPVPAKTNTNGLWYNKGGFHRESWTWGGSPVAPYTGVNDITADYGDPFRALVAGKVEIADEFGSYYPGYVVLSHSDGSQTRYAHQHPVVSTGQYVKAGETLGHAGLMKSNSSGKPDGAEHLHFAWKEFPRLVQRGGGGYVPWYKDDGTSVFDGAPPTEYTGTGGNVGMMPGMNAAPVNPKISDFSDIGKTTILNMLGFGFKNAGNSMVKLPAIVGKIGSSVNAISTGTTFKYNGERYITGKPLVDLIKSGGWTGQDVRIGYGIVMGESGGDTQGKNFNKGYASGAAKDNTDWGLWQINDYWNREVNGEIVDWSKITDPVYNTHIARQSFIRAGGLKNADKAWREEWNSYRDKTTAYQEGLRAFDKLGVGMASGGKVTGPGGPTSDSIMTRLSNGEFVMSAAAVNKYGVDLMTLINEGKFNPTVQKPKSYIGNPSSSEKTGNISNSNIEYNVNVTVEGTNSSPEDIAKVVIKTLKQKEQANMTHRRIG